MDQVMENVIGKMGQRGNERAVGVITEDEGSDAGDDDSADISEEAIRQIPTSTVAAQDEDEFSEEELFDEAEFDTIDESKGVQQHGDRFDLLDYGFNFKRRPQIYNDEVYYRSGHQRKSPGRVCSPRHRKSSKPSRSNIRVRKNLLNLIVESSDGSLEDATKYATEINSQNSAGIPLPEKTTELVTIPTTGPAVGGIRKAAIVRATEAKTTAAGLNELSMAASVRSRAGFYTATEKMEFVRTKGEDKENESVMKGKAKGGKAAGGKMERGKEARGKVKWANRLEW
ncbi:DEKNAAC101491 [Brettanomyces naardenensis]|uniref:DEKNAAC101491 n=1 Tax=Brettanomyces naardenensis TaxID=13370 RepID=A0A448YI76_BRENA|nr:DEKNAAC101491 [Brettanomyces naardenensis]